MIPIAAVFCSLAYGGELTPNITRNQIMPEWHSYGAYHGHENMGGYWSGTPDEGALAVLNDLRRFGLDRAAVEASWTIANSQGDRSDEIKSWNQEHIHYQWEFDIRYRSAAWRYLSSAFDPTRSLYSRLASLDHLIDHIGIQDYLAGIMPAPSPNYRVADTTWKDRR